MKETVKNEIPEEYRYLYKNTIAQAKAVFRKHFTCKLEIAPHFEEFEVARIPLKDQGGKFDISKYALAQLPQCSWLCIC